MSPNLSLGEVVVKALMDVCEERSGALSADSRMTDLGIDSVKMVWIVSRVEGTFGARFSVDDLLDFHLAESVGALVERMRSAIATNSPAGA